VNGMTQIMNVAIQITEDSFVNSCEGDLVYEKGIVYCVIGYF
jgi:hypothetical protein